MALLGGLLGVLLMIPLRRGLIVREHATLPYPEGTACAQVLIVGERGGASARTVFAGFGVGAAFNLLGQVARFWGEVASWSFASFYRGGSLAFETNPALLGVGYIIGTRIALVMLGGGLLSFWVLVPAIQLFAPDLRSPLVGGGALPVREMTPGQIRNAYLLYIGAGAVAAGGLLSLVRALPSLWAAFRGAASCVFARGRRDAAGAPSAICRSRWCSAACSRCCSRFRSRPASASAFRRRCWCCSSASSS